MGIFIFFNSVDAVTIFSDSFESGNFSNWNGSVGTPVVVSTQAYSGTYSSGGDAPGDYVFKSFSGQTALSIKFYVRFNSLPANGEVAEFLRLRHSTGAILAMFIRRSAGGLLQLRTSRFYPALSTTDTTFNWSENTWYLVEVKFVKSASTGEFRYWVNGSEMFSETGLDTLGSGDASQIYTTHVSSTYATPPTIWIDDVSVSDISTTPTPTLSVSLSTSPSSGTAPLNGVDLTASLSDTATGSTNYTFYCDRSDSGTNITSGYCKKEDNSSQTSYTAADCCSYSSAGTYSAKVIVERGGLQAEARTTVQVSQQIPTTFTISGRLTDKSNNPLQALIALYQQGTTSIVNSAQTSNGNYGLSTNSGTFDLQYSLTSFFIQNFFLKLPSLSIVSNLTDLITKIANINNQNLSFTANITEGQVIQTYSPQKPQRVLIAGTPISEVSSLSQLVKNTWYYDSVTKRLNILPSLTTTTPKCSDGTLYGQCSATKPKYCDNGSLVDKCSSCGCPANYSCQGDGSCKLISQTSEETYMAGFENASDFEVGDKAPVWNSDASEWALENYAGFLIFEPSTQIVHSSSRSAKLTLTNPNQEGHQRLEIFRDILPPTDSVSDIWLEAWYYIPKESPVDEWVTIMKPINERYWNYTATEPTPYELFQYTVGIHIDNVTGPYRATWMKPVLKSNICFGSVDNDNDGAWDPLSCQTSRWALSNYTASGKDYIIPYDQWFKITTFVHRDMVNGIFRLWYNGELVFDLNPIRTIGILPGRIDPLYNGGGAFDAYTSIGFSNYRSFVDSPRFIFVDDVSIKLQYK